MGDFAYTVPSTNTSRPAVANASDAPTKAGDGSPASDHHYAARQAHLHHHPSHPGPQGSHGSQGSQGRAGAAGTTSSSSSSSLDYNPPGSSSGLTNPGNTHASHPASSGLGVGGSPGGAAPYGSPYPGPPPGSLHGNGGAGNPWSYSVPSPTTLTPTSATLPGVQHQHQHQQHQHQQNGLPPQNGGYNVSNTRPMTAPSSVHAPAYYHASQYGGMFSQATYSVAGFPQSLSMRHMVPAAGTSAGAGPHANPGSGPASRGRMYSVSGIESAGLPDDPIHHAGSSRYGAGSTDPFSHQPPALSNSGYSHSSVGSGLGNSLGSASFSSGYGASGALLRPGTASYDSRRFSAPEEEDYRLGSSHGRPGTSDTIRPDTGASAYSAYSAASSAAYGAGMPFPSTHHTLYNTVGPHPGGDGLMGLPPSLAHKYNFIPLPSQPKKRPRRRFEEIERIYDCNYPGCTKAYGTLNHLNAHVSMQKHGPKRLPAEFKEIRKAWRQRKKESEAAAAAGRGDKSRQDDAEADDMSGSLNKSGDQLSPPSSGSMPQTPSFATGFGYSSYASPSAYQRPSTAPSHMVHQFGAGPPSFVGASAGLAQVGSAYMATRKPSITSMAPPFASIQEDTAGENSGVPTYTSQSPETPPVLGAATLSDSNTHTNPQLQSNSHPSFSGLLQSPQQPTESNSRPSTAPTPFRFNPSTFPPATGLESLTNAYDTLERRRSIQGVHNNSPPDAPTNRWSPDWTQPAPYKQEIH